MQTTEKKKPSRIQRLVDFIRNKGEEDKGYVEEGQAGQSLRVWADHKLEQRMEEWNQAIDLINEPMESATLKGYVLELQDIIQVIHKTVLRVAGVYACSGDREARDTKEMMSGWCELANSFKSKALRCLMWWGISEIISDTNGKMRSIDAVNVFNFHRAMINILFPYADKVVMFCFQRIDVTPRHLTSVQQFMRMPEGYGGPSITGSGGRTSEDNQMQHPDNRPVPKRVPNRT